MKFQFTYRHVDASQSLTTYAQSQFERIATSHLEDSRWQVTFGMGRYDYSVEVCINGPWGHFKAASTTTDIYAAVDLVTEKLERQILRRKEQLQHHKSPARSKQGQLENINEMLEYEPYGVKKSA